MDIDWNRIRDVTLDSRQVRAGSLFLALPGTRIDGAQFARDAAEKGAAAILIDQSVEPALIPEGPCILRSDDILGDAARLAAQFFAPGPSHVAAVTGTNGKTSVTWFARQLLTASGVQAASVGTLGLQPASLGTLPSLTSPDAVSLHRALRGAKAQGNDHLLIEASSHGLEQRRLEGLSMEVAAFTTLSQDHLDYHGDMGRYRAAKLRLLDLLKPGGQTIVNADDPAFADLAGWRYGWKGREGRIERLAPTTNGIHLKTTAFDLELPLIGTFQGHNLVCAWLITRALQHETHEALAHISAVPGRMQPVARREGGGLALVDYAHTPDALATALRALRAHTTGRLICVFGAGGNRDQGKRPLMGAAARRFADLTIVTDDNPRHEDPAKIRAAVRAACPEALEIGDRRAAIAQALSLAEPGDLVLIAGKGHESGQTVGATTRPFDDREIGRTLAAQTSTWSPLP